MPWKFMNVTHFFRNDLHKSEIEEQDQNEIPFRRCQFDLPFRQLCRQSAEGSNSIERKPARNQSRRLATSRG